MKERTSQRDSNKGDKEHRRNCRKSWAREKSRLQQKEELSPQTLSIGGERWKGVRERTSAVLRKTEESRERKERRDGGRDRRKGLILSHTLFPPHNSPLRHPKKIRVSGDIGQGVT